MIILENFFSNILVKAQRKKKNVCVWCIDYTDINMCLYQVLALQHNLCQRYKCKIKHKKQF